MPVPIFSACAAASAVTALIGAPPNMRLSEFGLAPQTVALPYAVWQVVTGLPENYINQVPDIDSYTIQVDVYATTATSSRAVANAIRDAIETKAHIVAWRGESKDPDTLHYRSSFDVTWFVPR